MMTIDEDIACSWELEVQEPTASFFCEGPTYEEMEPFLDDYTSAADNITGRGQGQYLGPPAARNSLTFSPLVGDICGSTCLCLLSPTRS